MMPADDIPLDIRRRLGWLPHLPYHTALGRRGLAAITLIGSFFQFKGNARVKAWWAHHGNKGCKVYQPVDKRTDAIMLWIHGGGYIGLAASLDDQFCRRVVEELGITVVSAEYRLAPKHRFPAGLDDCHASWQWMLDHAAELGCDASRSIVAGESAGGGLAAALAIKARDEGEYGLCWQQLTYPMLDDRTGSSQHYGDPLVGEFVWTRELNQYGWSSYLGNAERTAPQVPGRLEEFRGLPPAWMFTASLDLFRDENILYAQNLMRSGVACDLVVYPGACHAFQRIESAAISKRYREEFVSSLKRGLKCG